MLTIEDRLKAIQEYRLAGKDGSYLDAFREAEEFKSGGTVSRAKAREILHDGTTHGHPLTNKQRRYFGWLASKKYPEGGEIPKEYQTYKPFIDSVSRVNKIPPYLLSTVAYNESRFKPDSIASDKEHLGITQMSSDLRKRFKVQDPYNAEEMLSATAKYLSELYTKYKGNEGAVLSAYRRGEGWVKKNYPHKTGATQGYIDNINIFKPQRIPQLSDYAYPPVKPLVTRMP